MKKIDYESKIFEIDEKLNKTKRAETLKKLLKQKIWFLAQTGDKDNISYAVEINEYELKCL